MLNIMRMVNKKDGSYRSKATGGKYSLLEFGPSLICDYDRLPEDILLILGWDEDDLLAAIEFWENCDMSKVDLLQNYDRSPNYSLQDLKQNYKKYFNNMIIKEIIE